tara:strand:+ start:4995 stop:6356 length:1362 start_codon:yes stop_codon:yes gene_type:complete
MEEQIKYIKKLWKDKKSDEGSLVYPQQKSIAIEIYDILTKGGKICVTLCAPPQWGKTGVSLYLAKKFTTTKNKWFTDYNQVYFCTGMSDTSMVKQTQDRLLPCWKKKVFHRNTFLRVVNHIKLLQKINKDYNILIILDECHIANLENQSMSEKLHELNIFKLDYLKTHNIKFLQISATPSNALVDCMDWGKYHDKIIPPILEGYVSFSGIISENRIREPLNLNDYENCVKFTDDFSIFPENRYHIVRMSIYTPNGGLSPYNIAKEHFRMICKSKGYNLIELNSEISKKTKEGIFLSLNNEPKSHTIIMIKNMLRAGKTLCDKFIGFGHEIVTIGDKSYSSEVQGIPGRLCGWGKKKGLGAPIIYCDENIIKNYILLYSSKFDYNEETLEWRDNRMTKKLEEIAPRKSIPSIFNTHKIQGLSKLDQLNDELNENNGEFVHSSDEEGSEEVYNYD